MTDLETLAGSLPNELHCTRCGDPIERGYVAVSGSDDPTVHTADALCDVCGWREVGNAGCAPTLSDFPAGDRLIRLDPAVGGPTPGSVTDRAE